MRDVGDCKPFVDYLRAEHARLHKMLNAVSAELNEHNGSQMAVIEAALLELRDVLRHHFEEEEAGGCLEQAACQCPSLSPEVTALEREHGSLLETMDGLLAQASTATPEDTSSFIAAFSEFARKLHHHEAAETRILAQAFGMSISSSSYEGQ